MGYDLRPFAESGELLPPMAAEDLAAAEPDRATPGTVPFHGASSGGAFAGPAHEPRPIAAVSISAVTGWLLDARVLLAGVLIVAGLLRFVGLNWDDSQHLHPDERFITMVVERIRLPNSIDQYFDTKTSPLNPYNNQFGSYVYGTFHLFLVRVVAEIVQALARAGLASAIPALTGMRDATGYDHVFLVGRVISAFADVVTIGLIFLIGRRLYRWQVGFLAALLAAFTALMIQAAHYFTTEATLTLLTTLGVYLAIRVSDSNSLWAWVWFGIAAGLATATKISAAMLLTLAPAAAGLVWYRAVWVGDAPYVHFRRFLLEDLLTGLAVAGILAAVGFRIAQPYAFAGPGLFGVSLNHQWVADLQSLQRIMSGRADYPPNIEWASTTPFIWQLQNMFLWGMGPAMCIAAWVGFILATWQLGRDPARHHHHLLPLLWVAANFLYEGPQFTKAMRYLLPIYPLLAVFAAYFLISFCQAASAGVWPARIRWRPAVSLRRGAALAVTGLIVGSTVFYGLAFTSIYTRPNTRVAASRWIFQNIPPGSYIATEHWDDPIPLRVDGKDAFSIYKGVEMTPYDADTPQKRTQFLDKLDQADVIAISSDRVYSAILKMPLRYPMTVRYYQALFSGQLGFDKVAEFTSRPQLFGIQFNDDAAEELFLNYDHPKVTIFRKSPAYSRAKASAVLGAVPLDQVVSGLLPIQNRTEGLFLNEQDRAADQAGGTWSQLFNRASLINQVPPIAWWIGIELLGVMAFPLLFLALRRLFDGGWLLSKPAGLLLLAYLSWVPPSVHLVTSTRHEIVVVAVALVVAGALAAYLQRRSSMAFLRHHWRRLALGEALFLALFAFFFVIRTSNPDLWHPVMGGEKPMDFAYLNATLKTSYFPPYDPWFAGGYINYYYFGFVIVGALIKLLGIVPAVAYNLAVATLPAFACAGVFSIVATVVLWKRQEATGKRQERLGKPTALVAPAIAAGLFGALLVGVIGNVGDVVLILQGLITLGGSHLHSSLPGLTGLGSAMQGLGQLLAGHTLPFRIEWWYWNATRVIPDVINEFPFFTFLYGDLHAHAIALPYTILAIGSAVALLSPEPRVGGLESGVRTSVSEVAGLILLGLTVGALRATNTWDYPTYLLLGGAVLLLADVGHRGRLTVRGFLSAAVKLIVVFAVASLLFEPYTKHYATLYSSVSRWTGPKTALPQYLEIHAIFLFLITCFLLYELFDPGSRVLTVRVLRICLRFRHRLVDAWRRITGISSSAAATAILAASALSLVLVVALGVALTRQWLPLLLLLLLAMSALPLFSPGTSRARRLVNLLISTGLALNLATEFVVLNGDIGRMNTVFKFDFQVWVLWSVAGAVALYDLLSGLKPWQRIPRQIVGYGTSVLVLAGLTYTAAGSIARAHDRFTQLPLTDDGSAYMAASVWQDHRPIPLKPDHEAITWLENHVHGSPVILEGRGRLYSWASRISINTGLPTVLGWDWHETQQRGVFAAGQVEKRTADVNTMYGSPTMDAALPLLRYYHVRYIYVGDFERETYPAAGLAKFEAPNPELGLVYDRDGVKIWEVKPPTE